MRVIGWNICGGKDAESIATFVAATKCHVAVLSEFPSAIATKTGNKAQALTRALDAHGFKTVESAPSEIDNRVLIATRLGFDGEPSRLKTVEHRSCVVSVSGTTIVGLYMPLEDSKDADQRSAWRAVRDFAAANRGSPTILIGDVNTCQGYPCFDEVEALVDDGWGAYPTTGESYVVHRSAGSRLALDLALVSPRLRDLDHSARYRAVWPLAEIDERHQPRLKSFANGGPDVWLSWDGRDDWKAKQTRTLSDHAALVIEFSDAK